MLSYMRVEKYPIPHYNMLLPEVAMGSGYRPEKQFWFMQNGTIMYSGWGGYKDGDSYKGASFDISHFGIKPNQQWIDRAYIHMTEDIVKRIKAKSKSTAIDNIEHLILKFEGLDFISTGA